MITALILTPLIGVALMPFVKANTAKIVALLTSLAPLAIAIAAYVSFVSGQAPATSGYAFFQSLPWLSSESMDIKYTVGIDGISIYLVLLSTLIFPLAIAAGFRGIQQQQKLFYGLLLLLEVGTLGFFVSLDMLLFYVFFELVLIPLYFLVGIWGGEARSKAAMKFFLYTLAGSLLMLIAIIYAGLHASEGIFTTDYFKLQQASFSLETQLWLFAAFALSFGIKTPIFPLHTWQAETYAQAPTAAVVIMAALLSKMGTYGFLRFAVVLFPNASIHAATSISVLAVIGIIYGGIAAVVQTDIKKIIAYSSLSHLGFVILGIFSLSPEGVSGAVYQMVAHGVSTAAIFLMVGMLQDRRGTTQVSEFQGLAKKMPIFTFFFVVSILASVGLPGLSGFIGEFMIMLGAYNSNVIGGVFAILAATGVIIAAVYLLLMVRRTLFGEVNNEKNTNLGDMNTREVSLMLPLAILMLVMGLYAMPFLNVINPATEKAVQTVIIPSAATVAIQP